MKVRLEHKGDKRPLVTLSEKEALKMYSGTFADFCKINAWLSFRIFLVAPYRENFDAIIDWLRLLKEEKKKEN